jgi:Fur family transcriptional regulator, ferric uptake regulator
MNQNIDVPAKRNTKQKDAVRHALSETTGFVSAQDLHLVLRNHGSTVGLATVYRALADLAGAGEADSIQATSAAGTAETLFRACGQTHHHHLICNDCGKTVEIAAATVEKWAEAIAAENGFTESSHTIEIYGRCADCTA